MLFLSLKNIGPKQGQRFSKVMTIPKKLVKQNNYLPHILKPKKLKTTTRRILVDTGRKVKFCFLVGGQKGIFKDVYCRKVNLFLVGCQKGMCFVCAVCNFPVGKMKNLCWLGQITHAIYGNFSAPKAQDATGKNGGRRGPDLAGAEFIGKLRGSEKLL